MIRHNIVFSEYDPIRVPKPWGKICDRNLLHQAGLLEPSPALRFKNRAERIRIRSWRMLCFVDTANGNYQVRDDSPAIGLGFRNFPMDRFGVRKPELKEDRKNPQTPCTRRYCRANRAVCLSIPRWDRCKIKNIVGMGEVSAAGLPGETGVFIESIPWGSWQMEKGIQVADVVLELNGQKVDTVDDLLRIYQAAPKAKSLALSRFQGAERSRVGQCDNRLRRTNQLFYGRFRLWKNYASVQWFGERMR